MILIVSNIFGLFFSGVIEAWPMPEEEVVPFRERFVTQTKNVLRFCVSYFRCCGKSPGKLWLAFPQNDVESLFQKYHFRDGVRHLQSNLALFLVCYFAISVHWTIDGRGWWVSPWRIVYGSVGLLFFPWVWRVSRAEASRTFVASEPTPTFNPYGTFGSSSRSFFGSTISNLALQELFQAGNSLWVIFCLFR